MGTTLLKIIHKEIQLNKMITYIIIAVVFGIVDNVLFNSLPKKKRDIPDSLAIIPGSGFVLWIKSLLWKNQ